MRAAVAVRRWWRVLRLLRELRRLRLAIASTRAALADEAYCPGDLRNALYARIRRQRDQRDRLLEQIAEVRNS